MNVERALNEAHRLAAETLPPVFIMISRRKLSKTSLIECKTKLQQALDHINEVLAHIEER